MYQGSFEDSWIILRNELLNIFYGEALYVD
jgi:hypothetical protein